jgi:acyl-CoA synthetase (AMP-forming)/AMP-acid ligase II
LSPKATKFSVEAIQVLAGRHAARELWIEDGGSRTWEEFGAAVEAARRRCAKAGVGLGSVVVTPGEASFASLAWLFGAAAVGAVVAPLRAERAGEIEAWTKFVEIGWRVRGVQVERVREGSTSILARNLLNELLNREHSGLILTTGGTTGTAKLVLHDFNSLLATVPVKAGRAWRTMPLMRFDHIGGLDTAWRALAGPQLLVEPPAEITPESVAAAVARHRVEVLPATPSFLNLLLLAGAHRNHDLTSLEVVPYGAEPMPAGLLARLRAALPGAAFVERFGTSETGALPVHTLGSGLTLRDDSAGYSWRVVDGELWIQSPARALGYLDGNAFGLDGPGWFRTGDLAERMPDGSVRILGRREEIMNVGGEKVFPDEVESVLLEHPLVADCRVGPEPNAVLGQVVAADVVWRGPERDAVKVKRMLHEFAAGLLARHKLPAIVRLVGSVDSTRNLKKLRTFRS